MMKYLQSRFEFVKEPFAKRSLASHPRRCCLSREGKIIETWGYQNTVIGNASVVTKVFGSTSSIHLLVWLFRGCLHGLNVRVVVKNNGLQGRMSIAFGNMPLVQFQYKITLVIVQYNWPRSSFQKIGYSESRCLETTHLPQFFRLKTWGSGKQKTVLSRLAGWQ